MRFQKNNLLATKLLRCFSMVMLGVAIILLIQSSPLVRAAGQITSYSSKWTPAEYRVIRFPGADYGIDTTMIIGVKKWSVNNSINNENSMHEIWDATSFQSADRPPSSQTCQAVLSTFPTFATISAAGQSATVPDTAVEANDDKFINKERFGRFVAGAYGLATFDVTTSGQDSKSVCATQDLPTQWTVCGTKAQTDCSS